MRLFHHLDNLRFYVTLECLRPLPYSWIFAWLRFSSAVHYRSYPGRVKKAREWLRTLDDGQSGPPDAVVRRMFFNAAIRRYLNYLVMLRPLPEMVDVTGFERISEALAPGRGAVLLSCKAGFPRLLRMMLRQHSWPVLYLLRIGFANHEGQSWNARFHRWHWRHFHVDRDPLTGAQGFSLQYMKAAHAHLRANGLVNIAGEGTAGGRRHELPVAGRLHSLPAGGVSLGLLAGAPVLPCFTRILPGPRFELEVQAPLRGTTGEEMLADFAQRVDAHIRRDPATAVLALHSVAIPS